MYKDWQDADENIIVVMDGNSYCAYREGFINLQESTAGFGDTVQEAVENLKNNELEA